MPKDEFDFEDPLELNGVALLSDEDTLQPMAECFVEEFMRLGYNHKQILALFRNPHYLGMNMVIQNKGEEFVKDIIAETFARWGKLATWTSSTPNPLTPTLSPSDGERESCGHSLGKTNGIDDFITRAETFPLPLGGGEDQGEGVVSTSFPTVSSTDQLIEFDPAAVDPTGTPIPKLNL